MLHPAFAAAVSCAAFAVAWWTNRHLIGWLPDDPPRPGRKLHARPIPLAGIVLLPVAAAWLVAAEDWWLLLAVATASLTGFADDRGKERDRELGWRTKTIALTLASLLAAASATSPLDEPGRWLLAALFVFVLTNATNFLDNTNGVAATLSATSLLLLSGGTGPGAAIGFAALGFLPWNWPKARLFVGDAGAYLLGVVVAAVAVRRASSDLSQLWAVAVQLGDFVQVVAARLSLGLPPWVGDRRHVTHIAQNLGVPAVAVAPLFGAMAFGFGCLA